MERTDGKRGRSLGLEEEFLEFLGLGSSTACHLDNRVTSLLEISALKFHILNHQVLRARRTWVLLSLS